MYLAVAPVYRVQFYLFALVAERPTQSPTGIHRLQLLKVRDNDCIRRLRLLHHSRKEATPVTIIILARLIHQYEINFPQGEGRTSLDLAVLPRPLVVQDSRHRINPNAFDTL